MRLTAFCVRAVSVELARVVDVASSPAAVKSRFAFWADVVERVGRADGDQRFAGHPVARQLASVSPQQRVRRLSACLLDSVSVCTMVLSPNAT